MVVLRTLLSCLLLLLLLFTLEAVSANEEIDKQDTCGTGGTSSGISQCRNAHEAMKLKIIAITSILVASMSGVCLPIFSQSVPALQPDIDMFVIVKSFASGVILATGYMHVLPDSFEYIKSKSLPEHPWAKFPFTTFVAMLSTVATQMVDSFSMSYYRRLHLGPAAPSREDAVRRMMRWRHGRPSGPCSG